MRHPFQICAMRPCCFCCHFDPEITCYIIAVICILCNGFMGVTNLGVHHWAAVTFSITNFAMHLGAGLLLFMGTLWGKESLKLAYCWILFFAIFTVVGGVIAFLIVHKSTYLIYGKDCYKDNVNLIFFLISNTLWLLFWDIYTPMVVLGNLDYEEDICTEECSYN